MFIYIYIFVFIFIFFFIHFLILLCIDLFLNMIINHHKLNIVKQKTKQISNSFQKTKPKQHFNIIWPETKKKTKETTKNKKAKMKQKFMQSLTKINIF